MRNKIALAAALLVASLAVSGCHRGHPGYASDRYHHHHDGDNGNWH